MNYLRKMNPFRRKPGHHLLLWCIIGTIILAWSLPHSAAAFKRIANGDQMVSFKLKDLAGGEASLSDYKGKTVAILFWKNPCNRCDMAMRTLEQLSSQYGVSKGLEVIAVYCPQTDEKITGTEKEEINKIITEGGYSFPIFLDEGLKIFNEVGVITMPSVAIVDKEGVLVDDQPGFPKLNGDKVITEKIRIALGFAPTVKKVASKKYKPKGQAAKHLKFGRQMMSMDFLDKAIKKLEESIKEDPNFAPPHALLAEIYEKQEKYDQALIEHNTAIALDPEDFKLHRGYAFYLLRRSEFLEAKLEFEVVVELASNSGDGYFGLGQVNMGEGNDDEAEKNLRKAIEIYSGDKTTSTSSSGKGDLFSSMRKQRKDANVRLNPNEAEVHVELAKLLKKKGQLKEANEELLTAVNTYSKIIKKMMESSKNDQ